MLNKLPESHLFDQDFVFNNIEKIIRLCNNIEVISVARHNKGYKLALYARKNPAGRHETGIIYIISFPQDTPLEMLRLFSKEPDDCFDFSYKYYRDLVEEKNLHLN